MRKRPFLRFTWNCTQSKEEIELKTIIFAVFMSTATSESISVYHLLSSIAFSLPKSSYRITSGLFFSSPFVIIEIDWMTNWKKCKATAESSKRSSQRFDMKACFSCRYFHRFPASIIYYISLFFSSNHVHQQKKKKSFDSSRCLKLKQNARTPGYEYTRGASGRRLSLKRKQ